jgi:hypothetical protein
MKRCRRSKISVKKKMPETMMLVITRFSWSWSWFFLVF